MGKSVKIKISAILACLVLVLITGCGGRGVSEESAEARSAVPIVTYPVIPMKGEMIKNANDKATDDTADAEDEESDTDREAAGATEESEKADEETGEEAVKAESADIEAAGEDADTGTGTVGLEDGSAGTGAGEGYADGQDDSAVSVSSESVSNMGDGEYTDNTDEWYEDEGYIEPMPEPAVSEHEAEEAGEADASGDGEVLGESVDDGWSYYGSAFITHYDDCEICCSRAGATTASGVYPTPNYTVAAGYSIPFGTEVMINGNVYVVEDRGVGDGVFDIFVTDHETALAMGAYYTDVYIRW